MAFLFLSTEEEVPNDIISILTEEVSIIYIHLPNLRPVRRARIGMLILERSAHVLVLYMSFIMP